LRYRIVQIGVDVGAGFKTRPYGSSIHANASCALIAPGLLSVRREW